MAFESSNPLPKLGLLSSVLQWQAIIRQRAGTHARDNSVGGRGGRIKKRGDKNGSIENKSRRELMEKANMMWRRQKQEWKAE